MAALPPKKNNIYFNNVNSRANNIQLQNLGNATGKLPQNQKLSQQQLPPQQQQSPAITTSELQNLSRDLSNNLKQSNNIKNLQPSLQPGELTNINNITKLNNNKISKMNNNQINTLLKKLETQNNKISNEINKAKTSTNQNSNLLKNTKPLQPSQSLVSSIPSIPSINTITTIVQTDSKWYNFIKIIIGIVIIIVIVLIIRYLIIWYQKSSYNIPFLLQNTKNAKYPLVLSQDPTNANYVPILRSDGQDGIQFTYGFWFLIDNFDYKKGEWKHIFHKGNDSAYPNRAPGVWIHPNTNDLRVYMNTQDTILEYVDIENVPMRKWVYMNIILNQSTNDDFSTTKTPGVANLDIYINGTLKIRKQLSSLPKQNDDDLWINMYGGFEGYMSNLKYYPYAIDYTEISNNISNGPSSNNCINTGEMPPYLDDNWWFKNKITA
jgi:hypothetical protein